MTDFPGLAVLLRAKHQGGADLIELRDAASYYLMSQGVFGQPLLGAVDRAVKLAQEEA